SLWRIEESVERSLKSHHLMLGGPSNH
ncbi:MAG: hypothetical protein QOD68_3001, partial [Actinomycetota bacterium]|nr:hypothetical protein [Actinomycetota bacterium]